MSSPLFTHGPLTPEQFANMQDEMAEIINSAAYLRYNKKIGSVEVLGNDKYVDRANLNHAVRVWIEDRVLT